MFIRAIATEFGIEERDYYVREAQCLEDTGLARFASNCGNFYHEHEKSLRRSQIALPADAVRNILPLPPLTIDHVLINFEFKAIRRRLISATVPVPPRTSVEGKKTVDRNFPRLVTPLESS